MLQEYINNLSLNIGESHRGDCPVCNHSNTFSVTNSGTRLLYNCYHSDCSISGFNNNKITKEIFNSVISNSKTLDTITEFIIPEYFVSINKNNRAKLYLQNNNCWTAYLKNMDNILYDVKDDRVVFLVRYNNKLVDAVGRKLGKYGTKWHRYNKSKYPFTIGDSTVSIVCEDCASACAVTDWYRGVALMGTHLTNESLRILSDSVKVIVALDKDATRKAIDVVMRIKARVPTRLVTLDRDLKVLTKNEIREILK